MGFMEQKGMIIAEIRMMTLGDVMKLKLLL